MATYEIAWPTSTGRGVELVTDLPPMEPGMVLFDDGHFWSVDRIEPANGVVEGCLIVSLTHDGAKT
jgi:hypothetical protein